MPGKSLLYFTFSKKYQEKSLCLFIQVQHLFPVYWKAETETEGKNFHPQIYSPNASNGQGWACGRARSWTLNPSLPWGCQKPSSPGHHCSLPGSTLAGSWNQETKPRAELRASVVGCRFLTSIFTVGSNVQPDSQYFCSSVSWIHR